MKKLFVLAILTVALTGCSDYLFKKNDDNFWGKATPEIGKIIRSK